MSRTRNYCFTWNNYTESDIDVIWDSFGGDKSVKYLCFAKEVGENGTPHLQGYVDFINARTLTGLKKLNKAIHWDPRNGTWNEAVKYCSGPYDKNGKKKPLNNTFVERGIRNSQGDRNDLKKITEMIFEGATNKEILVEQGDKALRVMNHINTCRATYFEEKRSWPMDVRIYCGPPGTGKTRAVFDEFGVDNVFVKMVGKWWDGYRGERCVLIDDFDPTSCFDITYDFYLKLMDRYPMRVEWKNGSGEFYSRVIIFTSNFHPDDWFPKRFNKTAFFRRVTEIRFFEHNTNTEVDGVILDPSTPTLNNDRTKMTNDSIIQLMTNELKGTAISIDGNHKGNTSAHSAE